VHVVVEFTMKNPVEHYVQTDAGKIVVACAQYAHPLGVVQLV